MNIKRNTFFQKPLITHTHLYLVRYGFALMLVFFMSMNAYSQEEDSIIQRNAVFYELAGVGGAHTINYERIFQWKPLINYSARIGLGFSEIIDYKGDFNPNIIIPVLVNISIGKHHKAEFGIGQAFSNVVDVDTKTGAPIRSSYLSTVFNIGYRFQRPDNPFLFRAEYTPIFEFNRDITHWAGISIGYLF